MSSVLSDGRLEETLAVFDGVDPGTPLTTSEVTDRLDIGRRSTYDRLERLTEAGYVESKKVGSKGRVWWRPLPATPAGDPGHPPFGVEELFSLVDDIIDRADVGVFVLDDEFRVAWINGTTEEYFGIDRENVLGRDKRTLVEERIAPSVEDPESFAETVLATYDDNTYAEEYECHVLGTDDRDERLLEHRSRPIERGPFRGGRVELYYDVTERTRSKQRIDEERQQFRSLLDAVEEYAIFLLDANGRIQTWNTGAERIKGYDRDDVVGEHISTLYTEADREAGVPERNLARARKHGQVEDEGWRLRADGSRFWANVVITALHDEEGNVEGFAKVTRDMTDRRAQRKLLQEERDLTNRILEASSVAIVVLDPENRPVRINDRAEELLGLSGVEAREFLAEEIEVYDEDGDPVSPEGWPNARVLETGEPVTDWMCQVERPDGERRWLSANATPVFDRDGEIERVVVSAKDVTRLKTQERRLSRERDELENELDSVLERVSDAFFAVDADWRFVYVNDRAEDLIERPESELLGTSIWDALPGAAGSTFEEQYERAMETQEAVSFEASYPPLDAWFEVHCYPSETGLSVYFRDVTRRKERERELRSRVRQQEVITGLGQRALEVHDVDALLREAVERAAETLDVDYCKVLELDADGEELRLREGVGWHEGIVGSTTVSAVEANSQAAFTLATEGPVVVEDFDRETRFGGPDLLVDHDVGSGVSVVIGTPDDPWGVLGLHDTDPRQFSGWDVNFVQSVANILGSALERHGFERKLIDRRERLAALNDLNAVVRDITDAVIEQSTREEIERIVCERLAATDSYQFAWIGEVDGETSTVVVRTEAGVEDYLDGVTISVDPDDVHSQGPTGRALMGREVRVSRDAPNESTHEPWRKHVDEYGFRSSAAIPLVHDGNLYGVLNVYSPRIEAFEGEEREVVEQLGEVVAHAIASVERKQALMSDQLVEVEFSIPRVFESLDLGVSPRGRITMDQTVPLGDGRFLEYGTVTDDAVEYLELLVDRLPHFEDLMIVGDCDGTERFELVLSEPPVVSAIAANNGYVDHAAIEDGDYHMTIHLPPSVQTREIIEIVRERYPSAELVARRQITRTDASLERLQRVLAEELTPRQRTTLEAAFYSGYFEWPRESTGEDVAESLGVSAPTFHQHLRKAQRKVIARVVENQLPAGTD